MKKVFKYSILSLAICTSNAFATGIPVVDAASLTETILQYTQDLENYKEYIEQTALSDENLANALEQYQQMLTDYQQVLEEAESLSSEFDNIDLDSLLDELADLDELQPYYNQDNIDAAESDDDYSESEDQNEYENGFGTNYDTWTSNTSSINYTDESRERAEEAFIRHRNAATKYVNQLTAKKKYTAKIKEQKDSLESLNNDLADIGDNDTLKTLNLIARQNQLLLEQMLTQEAMANNANATSNQLSTAYYNNVANGSVKSDEELIELYEDE